MIFCLSVIYICLVIIPTESKDIFLEKDPAFDDLMLDENSCGLHTDVNNVPSIIKCASFCLQYPLCKSIFYNKRSKVCSIHGEKYSAQDLGLSSPSPDSVYLNVIDVPQTEIPQPGISAVVETCKELKSCNTQYDDGEYWLYPKGNRYQRTKIYCYNMAGVEPKEYITLLRKEDNESLINGSKIASTNPCKWVLGNIKQGFFSKIRIDPTNMEVNRQDVTFAEVIISPPGHTSFRDMEYAFGLGCSASFTTKGCPLLGYFKIDTRGTGLVVSSTVVFATGGENPVPMQLEYSQDNHVITAKCDGYCGNCLPSTPLILTSDATNVDPSEAKFPECRD